MAPKKRKKRVRDEDDVGEQALLRRKGVHAEVIPQLVQNADPQGATLVYDTVMRLARRVLIRPYDANYRSVDVEPGIPADYYRNYQLDMPNVRTVRLPFAVTPYEAHALYLTVRSHAVALLYSNVMPPSFRPTEEWTTLLLAYSRNALREGKSTLPLRNRNVIKLWEIGEKVLTAAGAVKTDEAIVLTHKAAVVMRALGRVLRAVEPKRFSVHVVPNLALENVNEVAPYSSHCDVVVVMDVQLEALTELASLLNGMRFFCGNIQQTGVGIIVRGLFPEAAEVMKETVGSSLVLSIRLSLQAPPLVVTTHNFVGLDSYLPPAGIICSGEPVIGGARGGSLIASLPMVGVQAIGDAPCRALGSTTVPIVIGTHPRTTSRSSPTMVPPILDTFRVDYLIEGYPEGHE